jgi:hypothetical protein
MSIEAEILLMHQLMDPLHKELLLEPMYHCGVDVCDSKQWH